MREIDVVPARLLKLSYLLTTRAPLAGAALDHDIPVEMLSGGRQDCDDRSARTAPRVDRA
jgi:hypothetical protein